MEVLNIEKDLKPREKEVRGKIILKMIESGGAVSLDEFEEKEEILAIAKKNYLIIEDNKIVFCYPIAGKPTMHNITMGDKNFHSVCAIDSMGTNFLFREDVRIDSKCAQTGEEVFLEISEGRIVKKHPENLCAIHVDLSKSENWAGEC